jgi:hypothetical protein
LLLKAIKDRTLRPLKRGACGRWLAQQFSRLVFLPAQWSTAASRYTAGACYDADAALSMGFAARQSYSEQLGGLALRPGRPSSPTAVPDKRSKDLAQPRSQEAPCYCLRRAALASARCRVGDQQGGHDRATAYCRVLQVQHVAGQVGGADLQRAAYDVFLGARFGR